MSINFRGTKKEGKKRVQITSNELRTEKKVSSKIKKLQKNKRQIIQKNRKPSVAPVLTKNAGPIPNKIMVEPPRYGEINGSNIFPRPLFKTREENLLSGLINARPGTRFLATGFLPGEEERFRAALDVPIEFEERDTAAERELKEFMIDLKSELKEVVKNGGQIIDIVKELRDEHNQLANYKEKLRMNYHLLTKEGTPEEAEQYRQESNKLLREYNIQEIPDSLNRGPWRNKKN